MNQAGFWDDHESASKISKQAQELDGEISTWEDIGRRAEELAQLVLAVKTEDDKSVLDDVTNEANKIGKELDQLERILLLSGEYDRRGAVISIHAGTGGVEAQDWAEMLDRMMRRYAEHLNLDVHEVDRTRGNEAGIKSVVFEARGAWGYGKLKSEAGVHRLVRISPFDAEKMRHTSFALIEVVPEIGDDVNIDLKDDDLRWDTFRGTGHGGQSVNTTDSAVRVVHKPTNLSVVSRSERSQLQNRQTALKILKAKLFAKKQAELKAEKDKLRGEVLSAEWGNQIRSYVLQPYQLVKDHRTGYESPDVKAILDGELDKFNEMYLRWIAKSKR